MCKKALQGHLEATCILPHILRYEKHVGASLSYLRAFLGPSRVYLGASWCPLEPILGNIEMVSRLGETPRFNKKSCLAQAKHHFCSWGQDSAKMGPTKEQELGKTEI